MTLITHPSNRLVPHRAAYDLDYRRLFEAASETGTFVEVDGAYLIDDVPNDQRARLRWVLEAYRSGKIPLKPLP